MIVRSIRSNSNHDICVIHDILGEPFLSLSFYFFLTSASPPYPTGFLDLSCISLCLPPHLSLPASSSLFACLFISLCLPPHLSACLLISLCLPLHLSLPASSSLFACLLISLCLPPHLSLPASSSLFACLFISLCLPPHLSLPASSSLFACLLISLCMPLHLHHSFIHCYIHCLGLQMSQIFSADLFIWSYRFERVQFLRSSTHVRLGLSLSSSFAF